MAELLLAIDQGTTGTKAVLFNGDLQVVGRGFQEIPQIFPQPGWVEQDPEEIWRRSLAAVKDCLADAHRRAGVSWQDVAGVGIDNQGETIILWDRLTGRPVYNAIVWQCRRTAKLCQELAGQGYGEMIAAKTGLVIDPYFSATKIQWILDNVPEARELLAGGRLICGTTDTWLVWKFTGGRVVATDVSTASRTMLFNIHRLDWDEELLDLFGVSRESLPAVHPTSGYVAEICPQVWGEGAWASDAGPLGSPPALPILALAVDQQAALFGHRCFRAGMAKATYGTGCFVLMNTGPLPRLSRHGILTTVAWNLGRGKEPVAYALDGGVYVAGAAVQWLRDGLGLIRTVEESESLAWQAQDTGGVYMVPALAGLAAPYWDASARGTILGLTRGTTREQLVRAVLEGVAYRVRDVLEAMAADAGFPLTLLTADGGASRNRFLMQFQADILGLPVEVAPSQDITAQGAAMLAGLALGIWKNPEQLAKSLPAGEVFEPRLSPEQRETLYAGWKRAVERSMGWEI
ncbi:MAG: glycerol kinase GlpK [Clostridia bacterium]|nr:glycerol kinase GlpK [Clostridia bacterium]